MKTIEKTSPFVCILFLASLLCGCVAGMSDPTSRVALKNHANAEQDKPAAVDIKVVDLREESTMPRVDLKVPLEDIAASRPEVELARRLVAGAARRIKTSAAQGPPPTIYCGIKAFDITTPSTPFYWDVTAHIELVLRVRGNERTVSGKVVQRTWTYPTRRVIREVAIVALWRASKAVNRALPEIYPAVP